MEVAKIGKIKTTANLSWFTVAISVVSCSATFAKWYCPGPFHTHSRLLLSKSMACIGFVSNCCKSSQFRYKTEMICSVSPSSSLFQMSGNCRLMDSRLVSNTAWTQPAGLQFPECLTTLLWQGTWKSFPTHDLWWVTNCLLSSEEKEIAETKVYRHIGCCGVSLFFLCQKSQAPSQGNSKLFFYSFSGQMQHIISQHHPHSDMVEAQFQHITSACKWQHLFQWNKTLSTMTTWHFPVTQSNKEYMVSTVFTVSIQQRQYYVRGAVLHFMSRCTTLMVSWRYDRPWRAWKQ